jgi:stage II sporulation protein P
VWGSEEGVISVGAELAKALSEKYGIPVLHSRKIHDYPVWREAYINSHETVSSVLKEHPTIEMVFDVHRDAGTAGISASPTVEIDGQKAARVFIVVTTDRFGLPHPNWRENLAFAYYLNAKMDEMYPGLSRGINVRDDARWNQHVHSRAVILEIGCEQNTRQEAERAATLLADVVACVLEDIQR